MNGRASHFIMQTAIAYSATDGGVRPKYYFSAIRSICQKSNISLPADAPWQSPELLFYIVPCCDYQEIFSKLGLITIYRSKNIRQILWLYNPIHRENVVAQNFDIQKSLKGKTEQCQDIYE